MSVDLQDYVVQLNADATRGVTLTGRMVCSRGGRTMGEEEVSVTEAVRVLRDEGLFARGDAGEGPEHSQWRQCAWRRGLVSSMVVISAVSYSVDRVSDVLERSQGRWRAFVLVGWAVVPSRVSFRT